MKHGLTILLFLLLHGLAAKAQSPMDWQEFVEYVQQFADYSSSDDEQTEEAAWMEHLDDLYELTQHPFNINVATKQQLLSLPFLSDQQVDDIRTYIERYHGMKTLYELRLVRSLREFEIRILPLFVFPGPTKDFLPKKLSLSDMLAQHRHELLTRFDIPLYHRDGYLHDGGYRGSRYYNKVRYTFTATQHIQASFQTERDAGERGIDSYGGQLILRDLGHLSTLVAGDFKAGFGEGLTMNQSFSMGKGSPLSRPSQGLRAKNGTDEVNFMRGVGATMRWGDFSVSAFVSRRKWDATLNADSTVKTILTSGYHRTPSEWKRKNNMHATVVGGNIGWNKQGFHLGATGYFLHTSLPLEPGSQEYRRIYPTGQNFGVASLYYGYESYRWLFRGETAYSTEQGGLATLNAVSWRTNSRYQFTLSQRYYGKHYYSFFASAMGENSKVQNETGATLRLDAKPVDGLQLIAYADVFYNPWPRYGISHSSMGTEASLQTQYDFNRRNTLSARYSFKNKEYAYASRQTHHRLRLQYTLTPSDRWRWQTTAMLHTLRGSTGTAIGEAVRFTPGKSFPLRTTLSAIYFHTTDYNSRVNLYETNVAGSLSLPSFFGHGIRLAGSLQYPLWRDRLRLELKYGFSAFFDRDEQSSGLQTIYSAYKNDIILQLRLRI